MTLTAPLFAPLFAVLCTTAFAAFLAAGPTRADAPGPARAVVELFTSQGCYSCPPADAHLAEVIAGQDAVVALEFHVDYWDDLVYGSAGRWRDPFSDPAFSARQRDYHGHRLAGRRGVYTPQMVVNGDHALVGGRRDVLDRTLAEAAPLPLEVRVTRGDDGARVLVEGEAGEPAHLVQVDFIHAARTPVTAGENHGKFLENHHIVTQLQPLGEYASSRVERALAAPAGKATGCAVLVQSASGRILGAAYCPRLPEPS